MLQLECTTHVRLHLGSVGRNELIGEQRAFAVLLLELCRAKASSHSCYWAPVVVLELVKLAELLHSCVVLGCSIEDLE